jgi:hypothetical protein
MAQEIRRLMAPWRVEETVTTFIVRTANDLVVSITYFDDSPKRDFNLRKEEARRVALAISRIPEMMGKDKAEGADP